MVESDCLAGGGEFRGVGVLCGQEDPPCPGLPADMVINEVMITHDGVQDKEFVEIYGRPNISLAGLTILAIEGEDSSKGRVDLVVSLDDCGGSPCALDANGFFVAGNSGVNPDLELYPGGTYLLEDGTQTIVLVRDCAVGYGADIDSDNDGIEDLSVGIVLDAVGLVDDDYPTGDAVYYSGPAIGPAPDGVPNGIPAGAGRCPNGVDTHGVNDWVLLSWVTDGSDGKAPITPHDLNPGCGGDYDGDADVDLYDAYCFQQCFEPGVTAAPQCYAGEFDGDGDIDLDDFTLFAGALGGP